MVVKHPGAVLVGAVLVVGLAAKSVWFLVTAAAVAGLFSARALAHNVRERKAAAAREADELAYRADRQHQWARRGDSRGVYGDAGAELMRAISPEPPGLASDAPGEDLKVAAVATTPDGLAQLLAEKPRAWRWAAFVSVLVQRRAAVQSRLRDCALGYATPTGVRAQSAFEVGRFMAGRMDEMVQLGAQLHAFMAAPAFMGVFGSRDDESTADADGIVHVANRLMDYHDRFLELAEQCRDFAGLWQSTDLMRDVRELMSIPLDSYRTFIDDFVDRVAEMPELIRHARGTVEADPVVLYVHIDDRLVNRITAQLRAVAKS
jgi:hypothetical protein